jgi:hypothetical protein
VFKKLDAFLEGEGYTVDEIKGAVNLMGVSSDTIGTVINLVEENFQV